MKRAKRKEKTNLDEREEERERENICKRGRRRKQ